MHMMNNNRYKQFKDILIAAAAVVATADKHRDESGEHAGLSGGGYAPVVLLVWRHSTW